MCPRIIRNGGAVAAASARRGAAGQRQGEGNSRKARTLPHGCVSPSADADVVRRRANKIALISRAAPNSSPLSVTGCLHRRRVLWPTYTALIARTRALKVTVSVAREGTRVGRYSRHTDGEDE